MPHQSPRADQHRLHAVVVVLATVLAMGAIGTPNAGAQSAGERQEREEVRQRKAAAATQLNGLEATDDQLESAVATLDGNVRMHQARLQSARTAVAEAETQLQQIHGSIRQREQEVAQLETVVRQRAVELYVNPDGRYDSTTMFLGAENSTDAVMRKALVESAGSRDDDAVDRYRSIKAELQEERARATVVSQEAERNRNAEAAQVTRFEASLAQQRKAQGDLETRIAHFHQEVDGLAAEDARLTELIRSNDAAAAARAQAAAAEQARASEAAALRAATATTAAPGTSSTGGGTSSSATPRSGSGSVAVAPPPSATPPPPSGGGGGGGMIFPCSGTITSEYGTRWGRLHSGMDISAPIGTPIVAARSGTVISAGFSGGYGNLIVIDHGGGVSTAYAHQSRMAVTGGAVSGGQVIGYVGNTGSSTGPHLHFEVRINGSAVNPRGYL